MLVEILVKLGITTGALLVLLVIVSDEVEEMTSQDTVRAIASTLLGVFVSTLLLALWIY